MKLELSRGRISPSPFQSIYIVAGFPGQGQQLLDEMQKQVQRALSEGSRIISTSSRINCFRKISLTRIGCSSGPSGREIVAIYNIVY